MKSHLFSSQNNCESSPLQEGDRAQRKERRHPESIDFEFESLGLGEGTPQGMQQISRQAQREVRLIAGAREDVKSCPLGLEKGGIDTEHGEATDECWHRICQTILHACSPPRADSDTLHWRVSPFLSCCVRLGPRHTVWRDK